MEWISNANVIVGLIAAIFGIGGSLFAIFKYLNMRGKGIIKSLTQELPEPPGSSFQLKSISRLEWIEIFTLGLVDTADFFVNLLSLQEEASNATPAAKVGSCAFYSVFAALFGGAIFACIIALVLAIFGVDNAFKVGGEITCILLFVAFSLLYIYQVGSRVERLQLEHYEHHRGILNQQEASQ